jgi:hypothetical protein
MHLLFNETVLCLKSICCLSQILRLISCFVCKASRTSKTILYRPVSLSVLLFCVQKILMNVSSVLVLSYKFRIDLYGQYVTEVLKFF